MGSFVPWLYYGFYCHYEHKLVYLSVVLVLGVLSIIVSLNDKFSQPNLRPLRAGEFFQIRLELNFNNKLEYFVVQVCSPVLVCLALFRPFTMD